MAGNTARPTPSLGIGTLSKRSGCNIETIRYYERIGLVPAPPRTGSGRRVYSSDDVRRLMFVRRGRELGFTLEEIRQLLRLVQGGHYSCAEVLGLAEAHLSDVRKKIADLRRIEGVLDAVTARCLGGEAPECPIVDALFGENEGR